MTTPRPHAVPRAAPARPLRWAALGGTALALCLAAFWLSRRGTETLSSTLARADAMSDVPGSGGVAIAADTTVTILGSDGHPLETRPLDAPVVALSWSSGALWTANGRTPALVEHRADGGTSSFAVNHVPTAIDAHEKYLWSVDAQGKQVHQYLITRSMLGMFLQPLDLYDLSELTVESFDMDEEGVLWLVDSASRRLYRLKADGAVYKPVDSAPLTPLIGTTGRTKGIAIGSENIWILVSPEDGPGSSVLKRFPLRRLTWTPA